MPCSSAPGPEQLPPPLSLVPPLSISHVMATEVLLNLSWVPPFPAHDSPRAPVSLRVAHRPSGSAPLCPSTSPTWSTPAAWNPDHRHLQDSLPCLPYGGAPICPLAEVRLSSPLNPRAVPTSGHMRSPGLLSVLFFCSARRILTYALTMCLCVYLSFLVCYLRGLRRQGLWRSCVSPAPGTQPPESVTGRSGLLCSVVFPVSYFLCFWLFIWSIFKGRFYLLF